MLFYATIEVVRMKPRYKGRDSSRKANKIGDASDLRKRKDETERKGTFRATKTIRTYVECTRDVITKKSPCCSKQLQSLINLLFRLILTHRRRPNPWHRGTDHSVAVISNQSRDLLKFETDKERKAQRWGQTKDSE